MYQVFFCRVKKNVTLREVFYYEKHFTISTVGRFFQCADLSIQCGWYF